MVEEVHQLVDERGEIRVSKQIDKGLAILGLIGTLDDTSLLCEGFLGGFLLAVG